MRVTSHEPAWVAERSADDNYGVLRLRRTCGGESSIGIVTSVNANVPEHADSTRAPTSARWTSGTAFPAATTSSGSVDFSRVTGAPRRSRDAARRDPYYQRSDAMRFDSTRTSLAGDAEMLQSASGRHISVPSNLERVAGLRQRSRYLQRADQVRLDTWPILRCHTRSCYSGSMEFQLVAILDDRRAP